MSLEDNKTIVRRLLEEPVAQGNFDVYDAYIAPDFVHHMYGVPTRSNASWKKVIQQLHESFSGHSFTFHDLIAEGDRVAARYTYRTSKHHSQFGTNPPTGQPFELECTSFFHFEQGKVKEGWSFYIGRSFDHSGLS